MVTDHAELLKLATEIAVEAGDLLRKASIEGIGWVNSKSTAVDLVTETDHASEALIVRRLTSARPNDGMVGEEGASVKGTSGIRWVIDPLDGTVNFTYGIPSYAVSIGAEVDGVPSVGAVYNPATDELFTGAAGFGALLNGAEISVREETLLSKALVATGFAYSSERRSLQGQVVANLLPVVRDIRRMGSAALDLCAVACGRIDAYYELHTNAWDVRAGSVIAAEAGAVATAFSGGVPSTNVIAANPSLYESLRAVLPADLS